MATLAHPPERARADSRWADLERLRSSHPMMDAVIEEVRGRRIRVGDKWLCDFASCNYLGFDLHPEIMASVEGAIRQWGTHPSWSRLLGNPRPYLEIEDQLTELLGTAHDHAHPYFGGPGVGRPGRSAGGRPGPQDHL